MHKTKTYIMELPQVLGDETTIYLETNGNAVKSLFAIVEISDGGASIVDNCYRTIGEAHGAWPEAIAPKPYHLTTSAIDENCTVDSEIPHRKLKSEAKNEPSELRRRETSLIPSVSIMRRGCCFVIVENGGYLILQRH